MNDERIGRNYAEALLTLARKSKEQEEWGALIEAISVGMSEDPTLRTFLDAHKVTYRSGAGFFSRDKSTADLADEARNWTLVVECWK